MDEGSARRRDLYLTHNTHTRQISMPPVEFEHAKPASERRHTHALDRQTTGICSGKYCHSKFYIRCTTNEHLWKRNEKLRGRGVSSNSEVTAHIVAKFGMKETCPTTCSQSQITSLQSPYNPWTFLKTALCVLSRQVTWSLSFTACLVVSACVMNVGPQDAASWAWVWPLTSIRCWS